MIFGSKQGRHQFAEIMHSWIGNRNLLMPKAGFGSVCTLCTDVMDGMVDDVPPVFDVACVVHQVRASKDVKV